MVELAESLIRPSEVVCNRDEGSMVELAEILVRL